MGWNDGEVWQLYDPRGQRKYLTLSEAARFLQSAAHLPLLRRACVLVLAFTGCRISEVCNLTRDQLDVEESALILRTLKRRKPHLRRVLVPRWLTDMLRLLSVARDGRLWPVVRQTVWRWVKATMRRAGVAGPMACPKGLRHGYVVCGGGEKVPETLLQKWAGHASIATTAIYMDVGGAEERELAGRIWRALETGVSAAPSPSTVAVPAALPLAGDAPLGISLPPNLATALRELHNDLLAEVRQAKKRSAKIAELIARVEAVCLAAQ